MPHIHEKIDFVATVYVVNGDAVLLRFHEKYSVWAGPGGHIELDEDPNQAAIREVKEEVGLDVRLMGTPAPITEGGDYRELIPPPFLNMHRINETHQHCDLVYFAISDTREITQGEAEVSEDIRWMTKEEIEDPSFDCRETTRYYALAALEAAKK